MSFWIAICEPRKREETCCDTGTEVPSHTYLAVRKSDDKVVGVIDLRHHINHPILGTWGGYCGYSVRPSERRKGYAREMLQLNIQNAKAMGIELPDVAVRILGIVDLIALPFLAYSTVKKVKND